jgi:nitrite reductase/ring-hydroxylating ferredoxin subunit
MRAIMEERAEKVFMTTVIKRKQASTVLSLLLILSLGCNSGPYDDPIPVVAFATITVNLNLPEFQGLRNNGYAYINSGGVKGIIIYRIDADHYNAYERNCSYKPNEACATVNINSSGLYMEDPCCSSTFDFTTGKPTGGPAWRPLNKYATSVTGSQITISDVLSN